MKKINRSLTEEVTVFHNNLVEARYRLSLQEKRVILWLASQIHPNDEDFKDYQLSINDFSNLIKSQTQPQYKQMRKVFDRLMQRLLTIQIPEKGETLVTHWVSSARYQHKKGYVILCFDPQLKPYLLQLKKEFTKLNVSELLELNSIYSVRIFELLGQYLSIGNRKIEIKDLREYCGIEAKEYKAYGMFKKKVIKRATIEINAKTPYEITYKEIKESRRVGAIEFTIKKRTHFEKHQLEKSNIIFQELRSQKDLIEKMKEYGFSRITAKKFIQQNSEEIVRDALKSVNSQVERNNVKNPKAMLRTAIQERWKPDVYLSPKKAA
jgi:plasmid replication initiation protein